jgi:hypothetical protein
LKAIPFKQKTTHPFESNASLVYTYNGDAVTLGWARMVVLKSEEQFQALQAFPGSLCYDVAQEGITL